MSQNTNYALISALYNSKTGGFYSDVYFPIIKYTIVQLFNQKVFTGSPKYYTAADVHDYINEAFKIHIPNLVITKSLQKINATKNAFVDLTLMENGNSFEIKELWNSREFDELRDREVHFSEGLKQIEIDYRCFLEQNGTYDDGVSYLQFIADNTEEVLGYFQNRDVKRIDEKYTTIVFFLDYLYNTPSKKDEFSIAEQLFWASIIAGYLRSEKPMVDAAEDGHRKEYFLDTSILMGLLELSSKQKEAYSSELKEIIKASGGVMMVHPITIHEIRTILSSVEIAKRPESGTDIAEAWESHHLNINRLASIRLGLPAILKKHGVQVFPMIGPDECKSIIRKYSGKSRVSELAAERRSKTKSISQDNFREIHDLFMDDYVKDRRKERNDSDDVVFVTSNLDLISFTKRMHPDQCYMISTSNVILDLWMYNVKPAEISSCALTETMARCLDQHNKHVRNKIMEVSKFFNDNRDSFDPQVYQDFIKKLYQRARNVIMTVDQNPDDQQTHEVLTAQRILDAVKADQEFYDKMIAEKGEENAQLSALLGNEVGSKQKLLENNRKQKEAIEDLNKENQELTGQVSLVTEKLARAESEAETERVNRKNAEETISLYKRRDDLHKELDRINRALLPLETSRKKAFVNCWPGLLVGLGIILVFGTLFVIVYALITTQYGVLPIGAILIALGIFFFNRSNTLNEKKEERRLKAYLKWEEQPENDHYRLLNDQKKSIQAELVELKERLS